MNYKVLKILGDVPDCSRCVQGKLLDEGMSDRDSSCRPQRGWDLETTRAGTAKLKELGLDFTLTV